MNNFLTYQVLSWFSSSYPIGSFNYSHGIEYAIDSGLVSDKDTLQEWISGIVQFGSARLDAILFKKTYDIFTESETNDGLEEIILLSNSLKASIELWKESTMQGDAAIRTLLATYNNLCNVKRLKDVLERLNKYPVISVVLGASCADYKIPICQALTGYLHSFINNLIASGIKLIPLGQIAGQNIMVSLEEDVQSTVLQIIKSESNKIIGSASPMVDWTSVNHQTQYSRLFQS